MVASLVRKVPSTVGVALSASGLFTTVIKTCICVPIGKRMAARVIFTRWAAKLMMLETSAAVSRGWPLIGATNGSLIIGWRISPETPLEVAGTMPGGGPGESCGGNIGAEVARSIVLVMEVEE